MTLSTAMLNERSVVTEQLTDLPVRDIVISTDTQARVALRDATIREYAELLSDDAAVFPPVTVFTDGHSYWLADGFHRHAAHKLAGRETIRAIVKLGSKRDATLYACQANGKHGLPMSIADKRRAVELMLNDQEVWETLGDPDDDTWTQRKLARHCGVSHTFIANMLRERDQHGNVATHARPVEQAVAPGAFVDEVLDHADAPDQPYQVTTTTFNHSRLGSPASVQPRHSGYSEKPTHPGTPMPTMTIVVSWSYADARGETVEGEVGLREMADLPQDVRLVLLRALGA